MKRDYSEFSRTVMQQQKERYGLTNKKHVETMMGFYRQVDEVWEQIEAKLESLGKVRRCRKGCCGCCLDGLTVTQIEASVIRAKYPEVLNEAAGEEGRCAFLDEEGACRIYEARPVKCRTFGIPMVLKGEAGAQVRGCCEERMDIDIDQVTEDEILDPELMDMKLGMMEMLRYGEFRRVELRSLFKK